MIQENSNVSVKCTWALCSSCFGLFGGFPGGTSGKEFTYQCRRCKKWEFIAWAGEIPWRGAWQPTLVFLPGNPMVRAAWWAIVRGVSKSQTWPSDLACTHVCASSSYLLLWLTWATVEKPVSSVLIRAIIIFTLLDHSVQQRILGVWIEIKIGSHLAGLPTRTA